jgi:serine/threonine-protein kinase
VTSGTSYSPPPAFGRFRLLHQIGAGVLGPVFRTHDPDDERLVAVKVFILDLTPEQSAQLAEEFRRLVAVELPSVRLAAPIDAGVEDSVAYLALQYVAGESLDSAIRQYGPAPSPDAARLISHVAEALDACARVGVFHGALHPRDILVTPGETHLTGMGVATALESVGARAPVRRPYAAPERETAGTWGAAADVFSLGAIAHEVLTGSRALPGTEEPLPGLSDLKVHDPAALREALEAALDPDPERRPATATDFAVACAAALGLSGGAAVAGGTRPRKRARAKVPPRLPGLDDPLAAVPLDAAVVPLAPAVEAGDDVVPDAVAMFEAADMPESVAVSAPPVEPEPATVPAGVPEAVAVPEPLAVPEPPAVPEPAAAPEPATEPEQAVSRTERSRRARRKTPVPAVENPPDELPREVPATEGESERDEIVAALEEISLGRAGATDAPEPAAIPEPAKPERADGDLFSLPVTPAGVVPPEVDYSAELQALADDLERFEPLPVETPAGPPPAPEVLPTPSGPRLLDTADLSAEARVEPDRPVARAGALPRPAPELAADDFRDPGSLLAEPPVPRALDAGPTPRQTSFSRRVEPYRPLSPQSRGLARPVAIGVVAGLLVGAVFGYWWGSRAAATRTVAVDVTAGAPESPGSATTPGVPVPAVPTPAAPAAGATASPGTAPVEAASARPLPTPVRTGTLRVRTTPSQADVFVDGERRGVTPRNVDSVPFGSHTVRVTRPGYQPQERTVTIGEGQADVRVVFTLGRAGRTAPSPSSATPGATAAKSAPPVKVPSQATAPGVSSPPVSGTGSIEIDTRPPGARVRIDNRDVGVTPIVVGDIREGTHSIRLELAGYRPWVTTVTVKAGARTRIAASLEAVSKPVPAAENGPLTQVLRPVLEAVSKPVLAAEHRPLTQVWRPVLERSTPR